MATCLHCEISELMARRQQAGESVSTEMIGRLCEVIADIAASAPCGGGAMAVFTTALEFLGRFEREIATGEYQRDRQLIGEPPSHARN